MLDERFLKYEALSITVCLLRSCMSMPFGVQNQKSHLGSGPCSVLQMILASCGSHAEEVPSVQ